MRELSLSDFTTAVGNEFIIQPGAVPVTLILTEASELPSSGRAAGSFRLEFRGPRQPMLEQAIYRLLGPDDEFEIFLVPIGQDPKGTIYEAVFF